VDAGDQVDLLGRAGCVAFSAGVPGAIGMLESAVAQLREISIANGENAAFLACLRERNEQGVERGVGPYTGPNYAPAQFEGMPAAKGYKRAALKRAMDRLYRTARSKPRASTGRVNRGANPSSWRHPRTPRTRPRTAPEHTSRTFPNASPNTPVLCRLVLRT